MLHALRWSDPWSSDYFHKLFIQEYGLDIDLDDMNLFLGFPHESWSIAMDSQPRSLPELLEAVIDHVVPRELKEMSKLFGIDIFGKRMAELEDRKGRSALYIAAFHIAYIISWSSDCREGERLWHDWINFGVALVKNGANPHGGKNRGHESLLSLYFDSPQYTTPWLDRFIHTWARLLHTAGVDLLKFGEAEITRWKGTRESLQGHYWQHYQLLYGQRPEDWGLEVKRGALVEVYKLSDLPGAFPQTDWLSRTITWYPNEEEKREGQWRLDRRIHYCSSSDPEMDRHNLRQTDCYPIAEMVSAAQDDTSIVSVMVERERHGRSRWTRRRSHSQPRPARVAPYTIHSFGYVHQCPLDGKYRLGCTPEIVDVEYEWGRFNLRYCVEGYACSYDRMHEKMRMLNMEALRDHEAREDGGKTLVYNPFLDMIMRNS